MLLEYFSQLDEYREEVTDHLNEEVIKEKQEELNVIFPQSMTEFYLHFGNDKEVLSSFYVFDSIEDIKIEYDAVSFGEKHEGMGRLGILLEDLDTDEETVSWYPYDMHKWFVEESIAFIFFFGIAAWQVLNLMPSIAKIHICEEEFKQLIGEELKYLSENSLFLLGDVIPVVGKGVLGCYLASDEELYLGTLNGDEVLEEYEELLNIDLNWL